MDFNYDFERAERNEKARKILIHTLLMLLAVAAAIALAWAITRFVLEKTNMVGDSMETTLSDQDKVLINKMAYFRSDPERFDVIVFEVSGKEHSFYSIRRVIGLPGERVSISDGHVYINGEMLEEPVNVEDIFIEGLADGDGIILDEDEFFVLGDNRNGSEDSRFTNIGNVVREQIIGKAWLRLNKFGFIGNLNMKADNEDEEEETEEKE